MGRVLDVVPNHMGIGGTNRFWLDVLEIGPQAQSAAFFDIDWNPVKDELAGRVLLPILEDLYGKVLEAGLLVRRARRRELLDSIPRPPPAAGARLVRPRSSAVAPSEFRARFDPGDEDILEYPEHPRRDLAPPVRRTATRDADRARPAREGGDQAPHRSALRAEPAAPHSSSTKTSPRSGGREGDARELRRPAPSCWKTRSTGWPTGGSRPRRSTTAGSST